MNVILKKMAPTLVVLAVAGYCCWSDEETGSPAKGKENGGNKPALTAALLTPQAAPPPGRDPFYTALSETADDKAKKPAPPLPRPKRELPTSVHDDLLKLTSGLVLRATFIHGDRRVALINDRFYAEGDALPCSKTIAVTIARIAPNKVIIRHAGQNAELKYSNSPMPAPKDAERSANTRTLAVAP